MHQIYYAIYHPKSDSYYMGDAGKFRKFSPGIIALYSTQEHAGVDLNNIIYFYSNVEPQRRITVLSTDNSFFYELNDNAHLELKIRIIKNTWCENQII